MCQMYSFKCLAGLSMGQACMRRRVKMKALLTLDFCFHVSILNN